MLPTFMSGRKQKVSNKKMKCPQCPYYEQKTSYGTEFVKCNNDECKHHVVEPQESEGEQMKDKIFIELCKNVVRKCVYDHLDKSDKIPYYEVYIVWYCKTLQNWKALASTTLNDGMYYELTLNGDKQELYLDAYKKFENKCIPL